MFRKIASACLLVALAVLASSTLADAKEVEKGSAFLSFMLSQGDGDFIGPEAFTPGAVSAYDHSEWGGEVQYQYLFNEHWAFSPGFGIGTFSETDEPGDNALPGDADFEYSQSSWHARIGLDRFVNVGDGFALYAGPGFSFWSGKAKFEQDPQELESESTSRIALDGRLGAHIALGETFGLTGYMGHYVGHASGEDAGAKATWWPSGFLAGMGASFHF
jgi:opacity protein-like surface antigen